MEPERKGIPSTENEASVSTDATAAAVTDSRPPSMPRENPSVTQKRSIRRVVIIEEPKEDEEPAEKPSGPLISRYTSIGRTPRARAAVEKSTHVVDSTDGVKLCVKTWPSTVAEAEQVVAAKRPLVVIVHQYSVMGGCQELVSGLARCLNDLHFRYGMLLTETDFEEPKTLSLRQRVSSLPQRSAL